MINTPIIVFGFDDGHDDNYTIGKNIFDGKGKKFTTFVITSLIDTGTYLTSAHITQMIAAGYDIQCHTHTHPFMWTLSEAEQNAEYEAVNTVFSNNGWPAPLHHAYPFGGFDANSKTYCANYRLTARKIVAGTFTDIVDKFEIPSFDLNVPKNDRTKIDALKAIMDDMALYPRYLTTYSHRFFEDADADPGSNAIQRSYMEELLDYADTKGILVKTMSELYAYLT